VKLRAAFASFICLAVPVAAHAQPVAGPYVSLGGGLATETNTHFQYGALKASGNFTWNPGFTVMGGVGYGFGDGLRVEIDGDLLRTTADKANGTNGDMNVKGVEKNYGGMANLFYDIPVSWPVTPFVGAGAGYQFVDYHQYLGNSVERVFGSRGSFAYDLIVGISYPIAAVPGLAITAEYRFMQLTQNRNYLGNGSQGVVKLGTEISNSFLVGLRYQLFQPPAPAPAPTPAPVAAPAPAPAKSYLVFFDWDKYSLTPRALDIISQAASDSKSQSTTTIGVSGYTDTSGTPDYNQGLSQRRATAVANQLVADGVAASEIETHAFGETHLLVPTGPGVREPQNRRVEIVLQ
jgi:OOP family OmpA-OmpF porin